MKNLINEYNDIIEELISLYGSELYSFHKNAHEFVKYLERNKISNPIRFDRTNVEWHLLIPVDNLRKVLSGKNIAANLGDLKLNENTTIYLVQNTFKQIIDKAKDYEISLPENTKKKIEKILSGDVKKYYLVGDTCWQNV